VEPASWRRAAAAPSRRCRPRPGSRLSAARRALSPCHYLLSRRVPRAWSRARARVADDSTVQARDSARPRRRPLLLRSAQRRFRSPADRARSGPRLASTSAAPCGFRGLTSSARYRAAGRAQDPVDGWFRDAGPREPRHQHRGWLPAARAPARLPGGARADLSPRRPDSDPGDSPRARIPGAGSVAQNPPGPAEGVPRRSGRTTARELIYSQSPRHPSQLSAPQRPARLCSQRGRDTRPSSRNRRRPWPPSLTNLPHRPRTRVTRGAPSHMRAATSRSEP